MNIIKAIVDVIRKSLNSFLVFNAEEGNVPLEGVESGLQGEAKKTCVIHEDAVLLHDKNVVGSDVKEADDVVERTAVVIHIAFLVVYESSLMKSIP